MGRIRFSSGLPQPLTSVTFRRVDPTEVAAVNKNSKFRVYLYKALLFLHVQSAIKSGSLNLEHSYKYRPLDH